jgi:ATP-dependent Lon protease
MYRNAEKEEALASSDLRISQSHDPFNLSSSGRLPEGLKSNGKKYAVIDHFRHEEDLQENLSNSIKEKERKQIQALIEQEKQREAQEQREFEVMEKLVSLTKNANNDAQQDAQDNVSPVRLNEKANRP